MHFSSKLRIFHLLYLSTLSYASSQCRATLNSSSWPSQQKWDALQAEVGGNLIRTVPPGAVCHADQPTFNNVSCAFLQSQWTSSSFHSGNPISVDYNDDTCFPLAQAPCTGAGYPIYVVNASEAAHVQAAVNFARANNVRLVVKGTGHDFLGRSNGPNSLSVWTHNIRGLQFHPSFVADGCSGCSPTPAMTIAAGMQMRDCYPFAFANNITFVGGADPDVGIGGWILGGGHSPISSAYGLGADNALEFTVVTAAGEIVVANKYKNKDLFWALRGGSPSFAILLSVTVKTYPSIPVTQYFFSINTTARSDVFWSALTYFHSQLPRLSEGGMMGYYFSVPDVGQADPGLGITNLGITYGTFLSLSKTASQINTLVAPLATKFANATQEWGGQVLFGGLTVPYPDVNTYWQYNYPPDAVGFDGRLGSRLLSNDSLLGDPAKLNAALRGATPVSAVQFLGHVVAGPGVRNSEPPEGNAVNPAWRKAYAHVGTEIVNIATWTTASEKATLTTELTNVRDEGLRQVEPNSGAYVNEADPNEPNWQQAFWGSHYPRLLHIKERWDPHGVFYCFPCVGAERWAVSDAGALCRT